MFGERERLAELIRRALGDYNDPEMPIVQLVKQLQAENKALKERIEIAIEYLPECPDKALGFLKPALQEEEKK